MTAEHRRLREITISLAVLLAIMTIAFLTLVAKYNTQLRQFDELEQAHLQVYAAYETCDAERYAP